MRVLLCSFDPNRSRGPDPCLPGRGRSKVQAPRGGHRSCSRDARVQIFKHRLLIRAPCAVAVLTRKRRKSSDVGVRLLHGLAVSFQDRPRLPSSLHFGVMRPSVLQDDQVVSVGKVVAKALVFLNISLRIDGIIWAEIGPHRGIFQLVRSFSHRANSQGALLIKCKIHFAGH